MYAQLSSSAILAAIALALPAHSAPRFSLGATGAVEMNVAGADARYGKVPAEVNGHARVVISLGASMAKSALTLSVRGDRAPAKGRYPIGAIEAYFVAGYPDRPLGWFHGESGWVTITENETGRLAGEFEIRARGFTTANLDDENQWVTVRGTFEAHGDGTTTTVASRD